MNKIGSFIRAAIFLVICLILFAKTATLLWIALLVLSLFFAVDVFSIDKNVAHASPDVFDGQYGVLGEYMVDATPSYGLFVELRDSPTFVDVREDKRLAQRMRQADYLYQNRRVLEKNLNDFIDSHPEYRFKKVAYIGLYSKKPERGEVFGTRQGTPYCEGSILRPSKSASCVVSMTSSRPKTSGRKSKGEANDDPSRYRFTMEQ